MKFCTWEAGRLLRLAAPVFFAQVTLVLMSVVDTIMAGQVSAVDLAALSIATGLWNPMVLALLGVLLALTSLVAHSFGANDEPAIRNHFQQGCYLAVLLCLAGVAIAQLAPVLIAQLDTQASVKVLAQDYIDYIQWGLPGFFVYSLFRNVAEGKAYTAPAFYISIIGLLVNIPANYIFIHGHFGAPALGGAGCGVATALVFAAMGSAQFIYSLISKRIDGPGLFRHFAKPDGSAIWAMFKLGVPLSLATFFEVTLFACIPLFIASLGAIAVAGHQVAASVTTLLFMLPMSLSMAVAIRFGNLYGQQDFVALKRCMSTSFVLSIAIAALVALVTYLLRFDISAIYSDNPEVIALAASIMVLACFYQLPDALQVVSSGMLRGIKHTSPISYITFISYWLIGFALGYVLGRTDYIVPAMGPQGFWLGIIVGLSCAAVLLIWTLRRRLAQAPFNF
ncbi:MATE family efflux transporter [Pseudoalteromonas ruthenica]|uniref:Multidrug-efflux transporter n=1 Tax=Pseudoalteromonas ruthenica TaxID=151081 RepID=A0A0F4PXI8_9GAMM|nr:MATE family efflux transporter [Pseudoalteromonas ruthenica]KJY98991.1 multidrug transporter MatE [Pseudoalteromonas ruthenica]KJZ01351.1 multidrug transporter MatE [Pseudoalteromonas ruthenica]TMO85060.1 MATE family efflux transporter [Pseudoalteromonas ruthenica]TMO91721.1 MATE family efflux transporter [Pseudoalteromonas ruthenica]TMO99258.1 MATE family efflux transporter [Pseudoalteromonas ruthenica]